MLFAILCSYLLVGIASAAVAYRIHPKGVYDEPEISSVVKGVFWPIWWIFKATYLIADHAIASMEEKKRLRAEIQKEIEKRLMQ